MDTVSGVSFEIRGATKGKRIRGCLQSEGLPRAREREQRKIEMRRAAKRIIPARWIDPRSRRLVDDCLYDLLEFDDTVTTRRGCDPATASCQTRPPRRITNALLSTVTLCTNPAVSARIETRRETGTDNLDARRRRG